MDGLPFYIRSLSFSGGQIIPLEQGSILLLVGPNNSGKSTALRDIANSLLPRGGFVPSPSKVVRSIEFSDDLDFPAVRAWAEKLYKTTTLSDGTLRIELGSSSQPVLIGENTPGPDLYRSLAPGLMQRLGTEERLNYANSTNRIDLRAAAPQRPIHWLQKDDKLAKGISEIIHNAFGGSLIIDWGAGQQVAFHVGDEPLRSPGCDRVSQRYMEELDKLPRLETLGDGIRSFVAYFGGTCRLVSNPADRRA